MKKIAVVGSGVSGLSVARMLSKNHEVTVFEKESKIGGLIKCERINDNLFHKVGGHVFNSRNPQVLDWFWAHFDRETEFSKAKRKAMILMEGQLIGYPLENHLYQLPKTDVQKILSELVSLHHQEKLADEYGDFEDFLKRNFGMTLYELYFKPYNTKIWRTDLSHVPLGWLDGKLPMPNLQQILLSNIIKEPEAAMVHATFYYPKENGSQFIVQRLAEGVSIETDTPVNTIERRKGRFCLNQTRYFDAVVYCGDIRRLENICLGCPAEVTDALRSVTQLAANGTSNLFCETDPTDISWLYLPGSHTQAHRIIYTGNFSESNSRGSSRNTCVVEFSGQVSFEQMCVELPSLPGNLSPIAHNYEPNSYVVQHHDTRQRVDAVKSHMEPDNFFLLGRFAEWEYYNMDKCIEKAMELTDRIGNGRYEPI